MDQKKFGIYFAKIREQSGYKSQRQLHIASGVSNGTISRIEAGTQKSKPETLKKLAPFLKNVTYEELMNATGYLDEQTKKNQNEENSLNEIEKIIKDLGIDSFFFKDIEAWKNLSPEDVAELKRHFEYVAHKAKERNESDKME